jgi:LmbE family N-acetylglucosaminyl deacetylase
MLMLERIKRKLRFHPRAWLHSLLTYPRFLGRIKPGLMHGQEEEILARLRSLDRRWETGSLRAPLGRRLLVIAPHPDDESLGVGGLLLAHRAMCEVHILNVFNGEGGGRLSDRCWTDDPTYKSELVSARRSELEAAAQVLDAASIRYLDLKDGVTMPNTRDSRRLREVVEQVRPDVVLIPWYLDNQRDHRVTNILYAWSCQEFVCMVLGYEVWTLCQPNAMFDITPWLDEKVELVKSYRTQVATVNYPAYVRGLGLTRAFLHAVRPDRGGAAEALFAVPNRDYCDLVQAFYGEPNHLRPAAREILFAGHLNR